MGFCRYLYIQPILLGMQVICPLWQKTIMPFTRRLERITWKIDSGRHWVRAHWRYCCQHLGGSDYCIIFGYQETLCVARQVLIEMQPCTETASSKL